MTYVSNELRRLVVERYPYKSSMILNSIADVIPMVEE